VRKLAGVAAALLLAGCSRDIQNTEAVRQGVISYLNEHQAQTGLDMNMMQVDVTSVSFQGGTQARAAVHFRPKGTADGGMSMNYVLDRKGDKWVVRGKTDNGVNPHGAQPPPEAGSSTLPPGHPPVGSKQ
jgi:hypothetical protein